MGNSDLIDIDLFVHLETDKAWCVSVDGDMETSVWIPRSQAEVGERKRRKGNNVFEFTMPESLAYEKELI